MSWTAHRRTYVTGGGRRSAGQVVRLEGSSQVVMKTKGERRIHERYRVEGLEECGGGTVCGSIEGNR